MTRHAPEAHIHPERDESRRYNGAIRTPDPSPEAFTRLLAQGRGLAALVLRRNDPAPYRQALLDACVENLQLDRQCEANRTGYMMRLLDLAGLKDAARERVLATLPNAEEGRDRDWMVDLLEGLATGGDPAARDALQSLAAQGDERAQDNLATVDDAGLRWVAEHVLPSLDEDDRWRIHRWLPDEEADDATPTQRRLREIRRADEARVEATPRPPRRPAPTPRELLDRLGAKGAARFDAVAFAQGATDDDLAEAAERLLDTDDRGVRFALRLVFRQRAFPLPLERLFALADDEARAPLAVRLLGRIDDPRVRAFALERLRRTPPDWDATEMLRASLRPEDMADLRNLLPRGVGETPDVRHGVVLDLVSMMDAHPGLAWQPFAEWILAESPCSFCRGSAVRRLVEHGTVPAWFLEEAPDDAEPDIRETVAKPSPPG